MISAGTRSVGPIQNLWPTLSRPLADAQLRAVSFGAGVQSTTMLLMAAVGLIEPMPDVAIFSDTEDEPSWVYEHLNWMESDNVRLPFPIIRIGAGSIREELLAAARGDAGAWGRPPLFIDTPGKRGGRARRQCTGDYKIDPINKEVRRLAGIAPRSHGPKDPIVEQWIGISTDEIGRLSPSRTRWILNRFPLVELDMSRRDCDRWLQDNYGIRVRKSACRVCPNRTDREWAEMKAHYPDDFEAACSVDDAIRPHLKGLNKGEAYIHRSRAPLREATFRDKTPSPIAWLDECSGQCGL